MGKASKWFRGLLGLKNPDSAAPSHTPSTKPSRVEPKRRWGFVKSYRDKGHHHSLNPGFDSASLTQYPANEFSGDVAVDASKHAIAVAAATAAVADAAVKAAQAAAVVVRLTSNSRSIASRRDITGSFGSREEFAAIKIQSNFRAYLSRRALRALKALVKLQALVRGHIVRKQTADMLRRMQALLRAQARARSMRSQISECSQSSTKSSHFHHHGPATPEKFEHSIRAKSTKNYILKRNGSKSYRLPDDEKIDKILEMDSGKNLTQKRRSLFHALASDQKSQSLTTSKDSTIHQTILSQSSYEVQSYFAPNDDEATSFCTVENSPRFYSASSRAGSSLSGDHPSYMAYTESSKAKVRSFSAPRQRPRRLERSNTGKINSIYGCCDSSNSIQRGSFASKAYPGSGRLDRFGTPVGGCDVSEISDAHLNSF